MSENFKGKLDFDGVKKHILAGNSILTFRNSKTGKHLTYKVKKHKEENLWFVFYLSGPDNDNNYSYLGVISKNFHTKKFEFRLTKKSRASKDSVVFKGFNFIFQKLRNDISFPNELEVWHEGVCGRCGRKLTHPESIDTGFGPHCVKIANNIRR